VDGIGVVGEQLHADRDGGHPAAAANAVLPRVPPCMCA
jgi:hypothetical protein